MTLCIHMHDAQRMNPNDFGDPLIFRLAPLAGQNVHLSSEISQYLQDGLV